MQLRWSMERKSRPARGEQRSQREDRAYQNESNDIQSSKAGQRISRGPVVSDECARRWWWRINERGKLVATTYENKPNSLPWPQLIPNGTERDKMPAPRTCQHCHTAQGQEREASSNEVNRWRVHRYLWSWQMSTMTCRLLEEHQHNYDSNSVLDLPLPSLGNTSAASDALATPSGPKRGRAFPQ